MARVRRARAPGQRMAVRNPLAGFVLTILVALGLSAVLVGPAALLPYLEFRLFYLAFALFGAGVLAGRNAYLGVLGLIGASLGAFVGVYVGEVVFWWNTYEVVLAALLALPCGLGGLVTGKLGIRRIEQASADAPVLRRCKRCGSRVGPKAEKCWSCKASLTF